MLNKHINPFVNNLKVPYKEVIKRIAITEGQVITDSYDLEITEKFSVYRYKSIRELLYRELSMYARDLFTAIQYFTLADNRHVVVTYDKMVELYGPTNKYGRRRFDETIKELVTMSIIDCKDREKGEYWFNPMYFSPSNRLSLYPECKIKIGTIIQK